MHVQGTHSPKHAHTGTQHQTRQTNTHKDKQKPDPGTNHALHKKICGGHDPHHKSTYIRSRAKYLSSDTVAAHARQLASASYTALATTAHPHSRRVKDESDFSKSFAR